MPSSSPSVSPTGQPTSLLWAQQKEFIKNGQFRPPPTENNFVMNIVYGVIGFVVLVVLTLVSRKTYQRCSGRSYQRGRSSRRRSRSRSRNRSSSRRNDRHNDYVDDASAYTPDFTNTFSQKDSIVSSQSYQYSLDDGIASPKSVNRRDRQPSEADSSVFSSETDEHETSVVDQMTKTVASFMEKPQKRIRRDVFAPAGKLGIIVDTSSDGPVVHSIKSDSPLVGKVFTGDYIVAVDDEDTSDWSAHYVTKLVARKSGSVRKLTLLSNNWDDPA